MSARAWLAIVASLAIAAFVLWPLHASPHDIYTGLRDKNKYLCCGANDCAATSYRERGNSFEFLTREGHWIAIPTDRIMFVLIPGDPPSNNDHLAHLCYGEVTDPYLLPTNIFSGEGQSIYLYCAFIPPGAS